MADPPPAQNGLIGSAAAPPHDEESEAAVLGAVLLADRWLDTLVVDVRLSPDDFYRPRNRLVFQAMLDLANDSEHIDPITCSARLAETNKLEEAGGKDYVETLVTRIPSLGNTKQYGQIVKENSQLRRMVRANEMALEMVATRAGEPQEVLEQIQQLVFDVVQEENAGEVREVSDVLLEAIDHMEAQATSGKKLTGISTGFRDIDELTGGLQPGNLIVLAARPSMGKSALITNIAENAAKDGEPTALFSLEMSTQELAQRFISSQAKLSGDDIRKGQLKQSDWPKVLEAAQAFENAPLWIDDSSDISIVELRSKARRLHGKALAKTGKGLGLIIVDYLQLIRASDPRNSRVEQVGQMSRGLKILARELQVPVIAVSQLSRAVENRNPPRPQLSDLRESGSIEQDADVVAFIYREEYYNREAPSKPGIADLIFAKHRNGPIGDVELTFISHYPKFANKPRGYTPPEHPSTTRTGDESELGF